MPEVNLTTIVTSIIVVLLLALPFIAARLPHSRPLAHSRRAPNSHRTESGDLKPFDREKSGPGPGFTYALVPPGGRPEEENGGEKGSWQWCLAFIPEETSDGGSELPPWWAPAPPWSATAEQEREFTRDADALQAVFEETSAYPAARSSSL